MKATTLFPWICWTTIVLSLHGMPRVSAAQVSLTIVDSSSNQPVPCRIHLSDGVGKPIRPPSLPFFRDHFVCNGNVDLQLPPGNYTYEIERGPEYRSCTGKFEAPADDPRKLNLNLERLVDLKGEGWWSGELHVHRPLEEIELLMRAEDLHVAPVMTWWNNQNLWAKKAKPDRLLVRFDGDRFYHVMGGEDEREGGALLYFNMQEPLAIAGASREFPSPMQFLEQARNQANVWIDIEKPFWWDVPVWLASGQIDSIGLANNHMCRSQMYESEAWGRPRDTGRLPNPRGNGFWTQEIYYHVLNSGVRLPPSAGSASGVLPNPVGYNRVYVHLDGEMNYQKWWDGLRAGRSFVSNGPLLRCRANGQWPGAVFRNTTGKELEISIEAALDSRDPISSIEIIKNGRIERAVPVSDLKLSGNLRFDQSGWFLVRTIVDNPKTFRFASTAPFYVEIGETRQRISRASVEFFLEWIRQRKERVKIDDPGQQSAVLKYHDRAEIFWRGQLQKANAD